MKLSLSKTQLDLIMPLARKHNLKPEQILELITNNTTVEQINQFINKTYEVTIHDQQYIK